MSAPTPFDLAGPLPRGRLAIEASAGTGKTYALSTLAARYVAEGGVPIGELLVVTFTRAAAAELRDRVRARLVALAGALAGDDPPEDEVLAAVWAEDRTTRLDRVRRAVADFDAATITTIHGFAQQVLGTLGSAIPSDPDAVLVDDARTLARQVATDLLVAEAVRRDHPADELPGLDQLQRAVDLALGNPDAVLVPDLDDPMAGAEAAHLRRLVDATAVEVARRRRTAGTLAFDDLLVVLRDALVDPATGPVARRALGERYRVALIDEFQDTDPVQWAIFDATFARPGAVDPTGRTSALVLVGDPKQAIYAFRGANVHTYLQATAGEEVRRAGLTTNWRSDGTVLRATGALLDGVTFGDERIAFQPVSATDAHLHRSARDAGGAPVPALGLRLVDGPGVPRQARRPEVARAAEGLAAVHDDLACHVRDLLETLEIPDDGDPDGGATRPLRPDDVAVLVTANAEGPAVRDALRRRGIPAVITRGDDVLASEAADHWHRLLAAVARPTDARLARAVALSWFVGWDAARLAAAPDAEVADLQERLHRWGAHLVAHGPAAFVGRVLAETGVAATVLGLPDGDRAMTDLEHVGELVSLAGGTAASPATLLTAFEELAGGSDDGDPEADLAARRIESESRAVQIMTTYVAKGLEFPVVCCPSLWRPQGARASANVWWDAEAGRRVVDVASSVDWGDPHDQARREAAAAHEALGANLRVLYVALTRARHHTVAWWLPRSDVWATGLGRVLFCRDAAGRIDPAAFAADEPEARGPDGCDELLAPVVAAAGGTLSVVHVDPDELDRRAWRPDGDEDHPPLAVATLERPLDRERRVWSFTTVTARSHDDHLGRYDPFADALGDAADADEGGPADGTPPGLVDGGPAGDPVADHEVPLGGIAGGAGFGTLVHEVLERVDFTVPDLEAELAEQVRDRLAWSPWPVDVDALVAGLAAVVRTPLGPRFAGRALADLRPADRLDELAFDLTLGEGGHRPDDAEVGRLLVDHLPADDPLRPWAEGLADGPFDATLAGSLTGSIDLVARIRHDDGVERFVVCDYKTNRLAPAGTPATAAWYRPDRLAAAMAEHHYPLQALLYGVAVHRYLRWRLPGYEPQVHLGGVGYLFVRGLTGPDVPTVDGVPHGLFDWSPPPGLVPELSDLLHGSPVPSGGRR